MVRTFLATAVFLAAMPSMAAVLTGPVVNPTNGNLYYLLEAATWTASQAEAQSLGGNLVTINDAYEDIWVFGNFADFDGEARNLWIGLNDALSEGSFVWVSGEMVEYTNWNTGEPNDVGAGEDYVHIWHTGASFDGAWNDAPNVTGPPVYGVVEVIIPEPTTSALAALGLLGVGWRRNRRSWKRGMRSSGCG